MYVLCESVVCQRIDIVSAFPFLQIDVKFRNVQFLQEIRFSSLFRVGALLAWTFLSKVTDAFSLGLKLKVTGWSCLNMFARTEQNILHAANMTTMAPEEDVSMSQSANEKEAMVGAPIYVSQPLPLYEQHLSTKSIANVHGS